MKYEVQRHWAGLVRSIIIQDSVFLAALKFNEIESPPGIMTRAHKGEKQS